LPNQQATRYEKKFLFGTRLFKMRFWRVGAAGKRWTIIAVSPDERLERTL
jgi:hypothetical protein